jgi:DNA-binding response OmpR family regulator
LQIALVEGDDLIRQLLEQCLSEAGHVTRSVAMSDIRRDEHFDLIVADVEGAAAVARRVLLLRAAHAAPILLLSARFRRGAARSAHLAQQLGVAAALPKPFSRDELLAAVAAALGTGRV